MGFKCLNKEGKNDSGDENFWYDKKKSNLKSHCRALKMPFYLWNYFTVNCITTLEIKSLLHLFLLLGFAMGRV